MADAPKKGEVFKHRYTGKYYAFVAMFTHPNWQRNDYVICQVYGNYGNEVEMFELDAWPHLFDFAWGPLIECKFCGFRREFPCETRRTCPNLQDAPLEDALAMAERPTTKDQP